MAVAAPRPRPPLRRAALALAVALVIATIAAIARPASHRRAPVDDGRCRYNPWRLPMPPAVRLHYEELFARVRAIRWLSRSPTPLRHGGGPIEVLVTREIVLFMDLYEIPRSVFPFARRDW